MNHSIRRYRINRLVLVICKPSRFLEETWRVHCAVKITFDLGLYYIKELPIILDIFVHWIFFADLQHHLQIPQHM